jgi:hypothetical protein
MQFWGSFGYTVQYASIRRYDRCAKYNGDVVDSAHGYNAGGDEPQSGSEACAGDSFEPILLSILLEGEKLFFA